MFHLSKISIGSLAIAVVAFASNAGAVTFNFQSSDTNVAEALYSQDGIDLSVTAIKNFGTTNDAGIITRANGGLGVQGQPTAANLGLNEALKFTFSPAVSLLNAIVFERGAQAESFRLFDSNDVAVTTFSIAAGGGHSTMSFDLSSFNVVGNSFSIVGLEDGDWTRGGRIAQIDVAAVPLPAPILLLGGGLLILGGVGWMRRREEA